MDQLSLCSICSSNKCCSFVHSGEPKDHSLNEQTNYNAYRSWMRLKIFASMCQQNLLSSTQSPCSFTTLNRKLLDLDTSRLILHALTRLNQYFEGLIMKLLRTVDYSPSLIFKALHNCAFTWTITACEKTMRFQVRNSVGIKSGLT